MRFIILAIVGIVSYLIVFLPGYFLTAPSKEGSTSQEGAVSQGSELESQLPPPPGLEPVSQ